MRKIPILTTPNDEQIAIAIETVVSVVETMPGDHSLYFASHVVALTDALEHERKQTAQLRMLLNHIPANTYWIVEQIHDDVSYFLSIHNGAWYLGPLEEYATRFAREQDASELAALHPEAQAVQRPKGTTSHVN